MGPFVEPSGWLRASLTTIWAALRSRKVGSGRAGPPSAATAGASRSARKRSQASLLSQTSMMRKPSSVGPATCRISPSGGGSTVGAATRSYCSQVDATSWTKAYGTLEILCSPASVPLRTSAREDRGVALEGRIAGAVFVERGVRRLRNQVELRLGVVRSDERRVLERADLVTAAVRKDEVTCVVCSCWQRQRECDGHQRGCGNGSPELLAVHFVLLFGTW